MSILELIQVSCWFSLIMLAATGLGMNVLSLAEKMFRVKKLDKFEIARTGLSLALGLSLLSYFSLIIGVLGQFTRTNLITIVLAMFASSIPVLIRVVKKISIKKDWSSVGLVIINMIVMVTIYLSAMQPPHTTDELHYHLPQAQQIVNTEHVDIKFGGHYFYGNIPKQMEVLYASAIAISGTELAHTMHFAYLVAYVLIVFGVVARIYGSWAGGWAVLMTLMYYDLTWNMISGFVDGAAFTMEISGLLFALLYVLNKNSRSLLIYAGVAFGIGASIKYSVFVTALFVAILLIKDIKKIWKYLVIPGFVLAGFWYLKNLIWFGNPVYPMYFGHRGVSSESYAGLMDAIQQFETRDWPHFVEKINHYKSISKLPVFIAIWSTPLLLLIKKNRKFHGVLIVYVLLYITYWFLLGTHQLRFLAPAVMGALILMGVWISQINKKILIIMLTLLVMYMHRTPYFSQTTLTHFVDTQLHYTQRQYGLGNITEKEFLTREFGCQYTSLKYLEENKLVGNMIDNYSLWNAPSLGYYARKNKVINLNFEYKDKSDLPALIKKHSIGYYFIDNKTKDKFLNSKNKSVIGVQRVAKEIELELSRDWKLINEQNSCQLFEIAK